MDSVSDAAVRSVVVMSAVQVGKTEILNNVVGFHVDRDPAPILVLQPTLDMGKAWSKDRLAPMLRDTPCLRGKVKDARARDSNNTTLHKVFPGGHITIAGANSAASLASRPIRIVLCDEPDRYPPSAGTEGDPVSLAAKRSMTFWNRKLILTSSPTIKGSSRIEDAWERSDQRRYFVPCPKCRHTQTLRWAQVRWEKGEPESAAYECEACSERWSEAERLEAILFGEWRASKPFNGTAGFHLNALVSPWVNLAELVKEWLDAQGAPEKLRVFVNTVLGETWEEKGEKVEHEGLFGRREHYGPEVPVGVALLTIGTDLQQDRIEAELVGWGRGEESWSLGYWVIHGDLSTNLPWRSLEERILAIYRREDGLPLTVGATCVDTGHHTDVAYAFCRERWAWRVWAIKGSTEIADPIWPAKATRTNKGKVPLFLVGVGTAKDLIFARLRITAPGPGYCHFPDERTEEYFAQLTAERVVTKFSRGFPKRQWEKIRLRNEALDCRAYAVAALAGLKDSGMNLDRRADVLDQQAAALREGKSPAQTSGRRVRSAGI